MAESIDKISTMVDIAESHRGSGSLRIADSMLRDALIDIERNPYYIRRIDSIGNLTPDQTRLVGVEIKTRFGLYSVYSDQDHYYLAEHQVRVVKRLSKLIGLKDDGSSDVLLAGVVRRQGDTETAISMLHAGIDKLKQNGRMLPAAEALDSLAHAVAANGKLNQALIHRLEAVSIATALGTPLPIAILRGGVAKDEFRLGNLDTAKLEAEAALPVLHKEHPRGVAYTQIVMGDVLAAQNKPAEARAAYQEAAKIEIPHPSAMACAGLGWLELKTGSAQEAFKHFRPDARPDMKHDDASLHAETKAGLAVTLLKLKRPKQAAAIMEAVSATIAPLSVYAQGHVLAAQSVIAHAEGDAAKSAKLAEQSNQCFAKACLPRVGLSNTLIARASGNKLGLPKPGRPGRSYEPDSNI